jgi:hypothetical protein
LFYKTKKPNSIMRFIKPTFFILCCIFVLGACKKTNPGVTPSTAVDVYIAGDVVTKNGNEAAAYWKNGQLMAVIDSIGLGYGSTAAGIAVNGNDVYMTGQEFLGSVPFYWKNGVLVKLDLGAYKNGTATCIAFIGNDLYVGGALQIGQSTNAYQPVYWKNGVLNMLSGGYSVNAITYSGSDIYFSGSVSQPGTSPGQADWGAYWKNGGQPIIDTAMFAADYIAVYGTDVYLCGISFINGPANNAQAVFTKNGKKTAILNNSFTSGIATNGTDVFTSGFAVNAANNGYYPWAAKNTSVTPLSADEGGTTAIGLNGSDVYIAGGTLNTATNKPIFQGYWKNGTPISFNSGGYTSASGGQMILVPKAQ